MSRRALPVDRSRPHSGSSRAAEDGSKRKSACSFLLFRPGQRQPQAKSVIGGDMQMQQLQSTQSNAAPNFRETKRIQQSFLANLEKRALIWLAARTPAWINSDHLTVLGLLSMAGAGACYWWAHNNRVGFLVVGLWLGP